MTRRPFTIGVLMMSLAACRPAPTGPAIAWGSGTADEILAEAARVKKPILFKFDASWCPYCARLDETVFRDPAVVGLAAQFLAIRVDGDRPESDPLMAKYRVKGYPTIVFARSDGEPVAVSQDDPSPVRFAQLMREVLAADGPHPSWKAFLDDALPEAPLDADPYWEEGEVHEKAGDLAAAKATYRRGGLALMARIDRTHRLADVRSIVSDTIQLLRKGEAFAEAERLCNRALRTYPKDFLYRHRYATVLRDMGKWDQAIAEAEGAYSLSYGRNRVWVADQLSEMLAARGQTARAAAVIREALAGVDWATNTREKERKTRAKLEERLAGMEKGAVAQPLP